VGGELVRAQGLHGVDRGGAPRGYQAAVRATAASTTEAVTRTPGARECAPWTDAANTEPTKGVAVTPASSPRTTVTPAPRSAPLATLELDAPRAILTPNSRRRCPSAWATTPYTPMHPSRSDKAPNTAKRVLVTHVPEIDPSTMSTMGRTRVTGIDGAIAQIASLADWASEDGGSPVRMTMCMVRQAQSWWGI